ncbi:hypothetical protein [uncultured Salipiger sp.]|jgi:hypothetical protein|uniref:hypothetical protein n=1 Tax=uncultured Salipiger sp. TaxID=499810 RepID=UPI00259A5550|nr:hypothetical protein [uncultured Salipiger sp.]
MTILDITPAQVRRADRPRAQGLAAWVTAIALVVLLGIPALMAPDSTLDEANWRGNSAPAVAATGISRE